MSNLLNILKIKQPLSNFDSGALIDVLLVDDREDNLYALEAVLSSPNYNLIKAQSGDQALRYLLDHRPAVILMDVQMPDLDGFETAGIIKRNERTRDIPIIFITAIDKDEHYVHKGYDYGAVDYLYKPYDPHILKSKVAVFAELAQKNRMLLEAERQLRLNEKKDRERQLAQLELKSMRREQTEQKKYLDLIEGIDQGVVWSADTNSLAISFVSKSAERILGYPIEQWSEERSFLLNHIHPDDRRQMNATIQQVVGEKRNLNLDHRMIKADGTEIWLHTGLRLASKGENAGHELRALSVDITKLKEAEELLRENKRRADFLSEASLILSQSLDSLITLSHIRQLIVPQIADNALVHVLNHEGIPHCVVESPDQAPNIDAKSSELVADVSEVVKKGVPVFHSKAIILPLSIRGKTFGALSCLIHESDREFNQDDLAFLEDLTSRVSTSLDNSNLYQEVQAAVRSRDEFFSVASHELKTPLTPLKLQIQILMRTLKNDSLKDLKPERIEQILKASDRQIGKLTSLIDNLMDISRISRGKMKLDLDHFDLMELIRDVLDRFASEIYNAKCEVKFDVPKDTPASLTVFLDQFRVEQIFVNLLTNAIKYGAGKPIHISVAVFQDSVKISFQDSGIGVAPEDKKRIFERFERGVSGLSFSGLGLGLYIVKQIVDAHGGKIELASELGTGSTFTVTLPIEAKNTES